MMNVAVKPINHTVVQFANDVEMQKFVNNVMSVKSNQKSERVQKMMRTHKRAEEKK